jgi:hypothetical protein
MPTARVFQSTKGLDTLGSARSPRRGMELAFSPGMGQGKDMRRWRVCGLVLGLGAVGMIIAACSNSASDSSDMHTLGSGGMFADTGAGTGTATGGPLVGTGGTSAPEVEQDVTFELPHAGKRYVYAANPKRDSVAVIDGALAIDTVEVGDDPSPPFGPAL